MGTIAEKSDYLIETKDKIKESINNLGGNIDNSTTFREYAEELDTIYSNLPKVTGENTEVTLTPTLKGKLSLSIKGNSTQETTNGYNLVNYDNSTITLVKSTNRTINLVSQFGNFPLTLEAGTYILSVPDFTYSNCNNNVSFALYEGTNSKNTSFNNANKYGTFTLSNTMVVDKIYVYINSSDNDNATCTFSKIMLEKGSTAHDYEPYTNGPAPNPLYPFPIKSVTGNNNVVVNNANLVNYNETSINLAQGGTRATNITPTNFPLTLQAGTYTLNYDDLVTTNTTNGLYTTLVTTTGNVDIPKTSSGKTTTFTLAEEKTINKIYVYVANADTGATATFSKIMLNTGSTATDYTPYQNQTLPLNLGNIELNKIGNYQDYIYKNNDKWYKKEVIGKVIFNGTEEITKNDNDNTHYLYYFRSTNYDFNVISYGKSNYLQYSASASSIQFKNTNGFTGNSQFNVIYLNIGSILETNTADGMKAKLEELYNANKPLIMYLKLVTPTDIEITDTNLISQLENIDKMKSYNGTTIITSTYDNSNAQMILSTSALKGE